MSASTADIVVLNPSTGHLEERSTTPQGEQLYYNDPNGWLAVFGGDGTGMPVNLSKEEAERFVTMQACVRIRAQSLSTLPLRVMRKVGRNLEEQVQHPVNDLLSWKPNTEQNAIIWKRFGSRIVDVVGNFYCWIARTHGEPSQLIPLVPGTTMPFREKGKFYYATTIEINGEQRLLQIEPRDMIHVYYHPDDTGVVGRRPLDDLKATVSQGIGGRDYVSTVLAKGGNIGGWIEHPSVFKGQNTAEKFREQWESAYSGIANANKTPVLENGMKYHPASPMSGTDAQTLENRRFTRDEIIGYYQIPPHMISVLDKANYNNLSSLDTYYIKHTLAPITRSWEMELSLKLLTDQERRQGYCVRFDFAEMRRGDPEQERQWAKDGITDGWMNRNEIRERNELPVNDDRLDEFTLPVNVAPLSAHDTPVAGEGDNPVMLENDQDEDRSRDLLIPVVRSAMDKQLHVLGRQITKIATSGINLPPEELAKQVGGKVQRSIEHLQEDLNPVLESTLFSDLPKQAQTRFRALTTNILAGNDLAAEAETMTTYLTEDEDAKAVLYEQ